MIDISVIVLGYIPLIVTNMGSNVNAIRTFRVLRPLKSLTVLHGMRLLVLALFKALQNLKPLMLGASFVFIIFSLIGMQIFGGNLSSRCVLGDEVSDHLCGYKICKPGWR